MIRRCLSFTSALVMLLFLLTGWQVVQGIQYSYPAHSTVGFSLNTAGQTVSKQNLADTLERIANERQNNIYKVTSRAQDGTETNRDLLVFGNPDAITGLPVSDGNISWASPNVTGQVITSENLGETPLSGDYVLANNPELIQELEEELPLLGVSISVGDHRNPLFRSVVSVMQSGTSTVFFALAIVLTLLLTGYFTLKMPGRNIRYLGGIPQHQIHREDLLALLPSLLWGTLIGLLTGCLGLLSLTNGATLFTLLPWGMASIVIYGAVFTIIAVAISLVCKPNLTAIRERQESYRTVSTVLAVLGVLAMLAAAYAAPNVLALSKVTYKSFTQSEQLKMLEDAYALNINSSYFDQPESAAQLETVLTDIDQRGDLLLSLALSTAFEGVTENSGGAYQDIILVNPSYLDTIGIDQDTDLVALSPDSAQVQSLTYWYNQFEFFLKDPSTYDSAYSFYTPADGVNMIGLGTNSHYGGEVIDSENVVVMVIEEPVRYLGTQGTLMPWMTTGNVFFASPEETHPLFEEAPFYTEAVYSSDRMVDNSLVKAQGFWLETTSYVVAGALLIFSLAVLTLFRVLIWARAQRENIFVLHSAGKTYRDITLPHLKPHLAYGVAAITLGSLVSAILAPYATFADSAQSLLLLLGLYLIILLLSYRYLAGREFRAAVLREE